MSKKISSIDRRSECPIAFGLDLFGDKWTLLVLRDILFYGKTRFRDFATREGISTNILADRLARLEKFGLITKEQDKNLKNQNIYHITDKGASLAPVLLEMAIWGLRHDELTPVSRTFIERLTSEREKVLSEIGAAVQAGTFREYQEQQMGIRL